MAGRGGGGNQTTVPHLPVPPARPPGLWLRAAVDFPSPPTPFTVAWLLPGLNAGGRPALRAVGAMIDRIEYRQIDGCVYRRIVPFGPTRPPAAIFRPIARALVRVRPSTRQRLNVAIRAIRSRGYEEALDRWDGEWRPRLAAQADVRTDDLRALDDRALDQRIEAAVRLSQDGFRIHAQVATAAAIAIGRHVRACRAAGEADTRTFAALLRPQLAAGAPLGVEAAVPAGGACFPLVREAAEPTPAELGLAVRPLPESGGGDERPDTSLNLSPDETSTGRRALRALQEAGALALDLPLALVRPPARELGRRLAERGQLESGDHVFMLTPDEARAALRSGESQTERVAERHSAYEQAQSARPASILGSAPRWPLELLPGEAREMVEAILVAFEAYEGRGLESGDATSGAGTAPEHSAIGVAPGAASGSVRWLRGAADLTELQAGVVALCSSASYGLAAYAGGCSALVAAAGGPLSPMAVVAQALDVPAIVGYPIEMLTDGMRVEVDGETGSVRRVPDQAG